MKRWVFSETRHQLRYYLNIFKCGEITPSTLVLFPGDRWDLIRIDGQHNIVRGIKVSEGLGYI